MRTVVFPDGWSATSHKGTPIFVAVSSVRHNAIRVNLYACRARPWNCSWGINAASQCLLLASWRWWRWLKSLLLDPCRTKLDVNPPTLLNCYVKCLRITTNPFFPQDPSARIRKWAGFSFATMLLNQRRLIKEAERWQREILSSALESSTSENDTSQLVCLTTARSSNTVIGASRIVVKNKHNKNCFADQALRCNLDTQVEQELWVLHLTESFTPLKPQLNFENESSELDNNLCWNFGQLPKWPVFDLLGTEHLRNNNPGTSRFHPWRSLKCCQRQHAFGRRDTCLPRAPGGTASLPPLPERMWCEQWSLCIHALWRSERRKESTSTANRTNECSQHVFGSRVSQPIAEETIGVVLGLRQRPSRSSRYAQSWARSVSLDPTSSASFFSRANISTQRDVPFLQTATLNSLVSSAFASVHTSPRSASRDWGAHTDSCRSAGSQHTKSVTIETWEIKKKYFHNEVEARNGSKVGFRHVLLTTTVTSIRRGWRSQEQSPSPRTKRSNRKTRPNQPSGLLPGVR